VLKVSGNRCSRGIAYAQEEINAPKRTVTATCALLIDKTQAQSPYAPRRVPVKTTIPCPKEKISALLSDIYNTKVPLPVKMGSAVITNWNQTGIDVVATRNIA